MKKYLFLLLLLGAIIIPINTFALSSEDTYEVKCKTYNLDTSNQDSIFHYLYFTYYDTLENKEDYSYFFGEQTNNQITSYVFLIYKTADTTFQCRVWSTSKLIRFNSTSNMTAYFFDTSTLELTNSTYTQLQVPTGLGNVPGRFIYSSNNIHATDSNNNTFDFSANSSSTDILDSYTDNCNINESCNCNVNVDFPFTKTDFYTLLVLVGTIIMMLFFKWTFPMKGGRKL